MINQLATLARRLRSDPLLGNSALLALSTGVMAAFGFVFFLVLARFYTPAQVGVGTALVSACGLIAAVSLVGVNTAFLRYLPLAGDRDAHLNTGLVAVTCSAAVLATGYTLVLPAVAPRLAAALSSPAAAAAFVVMTAATAINLVTDSAFIAYRSTGYVVLIDGFVQGGGKLLLAGALVVAGAFGVLTAAGAAAAMAAVASVLVLRARFGYRPRPVVHRAVLREVSGFSWASYAANLINYAPVLLIPVVVVDLRGPADAAAFYLAFMIANLLYAASYAVDQTLFTETSYRTETERALLRRALMWLAVTVVPGALVLVALRGLVLTAFGPAYSASAAGPLLVLAVGAPVVAWRVLVGVLLRSRGRLAALVAVNAAFAAAVVGLAVAWAPLTLTGVAWAWLCGNVVGGTLGLLALLVPGRRSAPVTAARAATGHAATTHPATTHPATPQRATTPSSPGSPAPVAGDPGVHRPLA